MPPSLPGEEWRPIPSAPGYFASSLGRISGPKKPIMNARLSDGGYLRVAIRVGKTPKATSVNRLVCEAFHGPPPSEDHHSAHRDNNRTNNTSDNLKWATPAENQADRISHGTHIHGEKHAMAKLSDVEAQEIRDAYLVHGARKRAPAGFRDDLAKKYGVSVYTITAIGRMTKRAFAEPRNV